MDRWYRRVPVVTGGAGVVEGTDPLSTLRCRTTLAMIQTTPTQNAIIISAIIIQPQAPGPSCNLLSQCIIAFVLCNPKGHMSKA